MCDRFYEKKIGESEGADDFATSFYTTMSSPTHILVPSGKADADALECNSIIYDQIESLRTGQIHLSQQLLSERTVNQKVRQDLDLAEKAYLECSLKRNDSGRRLSESRVQATKLQLDVVELQKGTKKVQTLD